MSDPLRILIVEDVPTDAELAEREIRKAGFDFVTRRVETRDDFLAALGDFRPDLILSDYLLPSFDAMTALKLALERTPMTPFIVFTGSMNEVTAVECMMAGATDYIIKEHVSRLGLSIKKALDQKSAKDEKMRAERLLRESELRYRLLAENARDMIFRFRLVPDRAYEYMSPAVERITGYTPAEFYADPLIRERIVVPEDRRRLNEIVDGTRPFDDPLVQRWIRKDGFTIWVEERNVPIKNASGEIVAIEGIIRDISERKEAEQKLRDSHEMLHRLSSHIQTAREEERMSIAREIHDDLGQALTALNMHLALMNNTGEPAALAARKKTMLELMERAMKSVQRISTDLRPGILDDFGLEAAIEWQVEEFQKRTGIPCDLTVRHPAGLLDKPSQTALFRILQEGLSNIQQHARATRIKVSLLERNAFSLLEVSDNGRGITKEERDNPRSFGLMGMRERAYALGGEVEIQGAPGRGTTLRATIPMGEGRAD